MDYRTLFDETCRLDMGENFCCFYYPGAGTAQLDCESKYPMLFVLQGALDMRLGYDTPRIEAGNLCVVDRSKLMEYRTKASTVIMVYQPPPRLSALFSTCCHIYQMASSENVPILPALREWIDIQLEKSVQGRRCMGEEAHRQRKELLHILTSYTRKELNELATPFSVCPLGDCEKCDESMSSNVPACTEAVGESVF